MRLIKSAIIFTFLLSGFISVSHAAERPNIIFFLSDDQRADFLSCAGHPIVQTPSIDKLTAAGTRFENDFFCEHLMDHQAIPKYEGVRGSRYVYARYFQNMPEGEFLHDLQSDPHQLNNLISDPKAAKILDSMRSRCDELRDSLGGEYSLESVPTLKYLREKQKQQKQ